MSGKKKQTKKVQQGFFERFTCSGNIFVCLLRKCLDTSITGKLIGMLVVSLLGFSLVIIQHAIALKKIEKRNHSIQKISIPQYKASQYILRSTNGFKISLLHILHEENLTEQDNNIIANQQHIADLQRMLDSLAAGGCENQGGYS